MKYKIGQIWQYYTGQEYLLYDIDLDLEYNFYHISMQSVEPVLDKYSNQLVYEYCRTVADLSLECKSSFKLVRDI